MPRKLWLIASLVLFGSGSAAQAQLAWWYIPTDPFGGGYYGSGWGPTTNIYGGTYGWSPGYPAYPYGYDYGYGYPYTSPVYPLYIDGHGLGEARRGLAEVIRSEGEAGKALSEAAIAAEEARSRAIENDLKAQAAYLEKQRLGREAREQYYAEKREARQRYLAQKHQQPAPVTPPLGPEQLDPATGAVSWTLALRSPVFDDVRNEVEELLILRAFSKIDVSAELAAAVRDFQEQLKENITRFGTDEYLDARRFLESLALEAM